MTWFKNKIKNIELIDLDKDSENEVISDLFPHPWAGRVAHPRSFLPLEGGGLRRGWSRDSIHQARKKLIL